MQTLDELLSPEPHATFHDATVVELQHDAVQSSGSLTADLCVGDPDAPTDTDRGRRRRGRLTLRGVRLWREERYDPGTSSSGDWLTAEGPLTEATTELSQTLQGEFGTEPYCWFFYFSDSNSFLYWTAEDVAFEWLGPPQPAA